MARFQFKRFKKIINKFKKSKRNFGVYDEKINLKKRLYTSIFLICSFIFNYKFNFFLIYSLIILCFFFNRIFNLVIKFLKLNFILFLLSIFFQLYVLFFVAFFFYF